MISKRIKDRCAFINEHLKDPPMLFFMKPDIQTIANRQKLIIGLLTLICDELNINPEIGEEE